jgi:hypothetical protein
MTEKKRGFNRRGKCVKCKSILEAKCSNCGSKKIKRILNIDIKEEWFFCKKCHINSYWILCENCYTSNPLKIFGHNYGCISCLFWIIIIYIIALALAK